MEQVKNNAPVEDIKSKLSSETQRLADRFANLKMFEDGHFFDFDTKFEESFDVSGELLTEEEKKSFFELLKKCKNKEIEDDEIVKLAKYLLKYTGSAYKGNYVEDISMHDYGEDSYVLGDCDWELKRIRLNSRFFNKNTLYKYCIRLFTTIYHENGHYQMGEFVEDYEKDPSILNNLSIEDKEFFLTYIQSKNQYTKLTSDEINEIYKTIKVDIIQEIKDKNIPDAIINVYNDICDYVESFGKTKSFTKYRDKIEMLRSDQLSDGDLIKEINAVINLFLNSKKEAESGTEKEISLKIYDILKKNVNLQTFEDLRNKYIKYNLTNEKIKNLEFANYLTIKEEEKSRSIGLRNTGMALINLLYEKDLDEDVKIWLTKNLDKYVEIAEHEQENRDKFYPLNNELNIDLSDNIVVLKHEYAYDKKNINKKLQDILSRKSLKEIAQKYMERVSEIGKTSDIFYISFELNLIFKNSVDEKGKEEAKEYIKNELENIKYGYNQGLDYIKYNYILSDDDTIDIMTDFNKAKKFDYVNSLLNVGLLKPNSKSSERIKNEVLGSYVKFLNKIKDKEKISEKEAYYLYEIGNIHSSLEVIKSIQTTDIEEIIKDFMSLYEEVKMKFENEKECNSLCDISLSKSKAELKWYKYKKEIYGEEYANEFKQNILEKAEKDRLLFGISQEEFEEYFNVNSNDVAFEV